ncbi:MAG: FlgD immunoglobulin-like domain containing protein [Candidatus Eiseniibacteriota bacterium]
MKGSRVRARVSPAASRAVLCASLALFCTAPVLGQEYDFLYVDAFQSTYDLKESYLFDINNRGQGCGFATDLPAYAGFFWSAETDKVRIPFTYARGINESGKIAGLNRVIDTVTGELVTIPLVPGAVATPVALDINDHDIVVGYAETCICSNSNRILQIPFIWDPVEGSRSVSVSGAKELVKVNNQGVAVGIIRGGSRDGFVYEIATGRTIRLGAFLPTNPYPWTEAADINDLGVVTGKHRSDDAISFHGYVWSEAGGATLLPHLLGNPALDVFPAAINDAGIVVGTAEVSEHVWHAFVWDDAGGMQDLNDLVTLPPNFILDRALEINDAGWIVGDGHFGPTWSSSQAFVLIPRNIVLTVPSTPATADLRVFPNPSTGPARIEYASPEGGTAHVRIFDASGRKVAEMVEADRPAGANVLRWDGRDRAGRNVPAGAYLVRLELAGRTITRKLAVVH